MSDECESVFSQEKLVMSGQRIPSPPEAQHSGGLAMLEELAKAFEL